MDDFSVARQIRRLERKLGIQKHDAKIIVNDVSDIMRESEDIDPVKFEVLIDYAVDIVYRIGLSGNNIKTK